MGYRVRRRRRRIRIAVSSVLILICCIFLVSCMVSANVTWARGLLGYDVTDYEAEAVTAELEIESGLSRELCSMVSILSADRGISLTPFSTTAEAVSQYRDAILGYMLRDNYSRYTGNRSELERVHAAYPQMNLSTVIPVSDFENTVFRYFGGTSVKNESGALYSYLNRASCYTAPVQGRTHNVSTAVQSLEETAHTYRMQFLLSDETGESTPYTAVFLKREDGSCYFRSLSVAI